MVRQRLLRYLSVRARAAGKGARQCTHTITTFALLSRFRVACEEPSRVCVACEEPSRVCVACEEPPSELVCEASSLGDRLAEWNVPDAAVGDCLGASLGPNQWFVGNDLTLEGMVEGVVEWDSEDCLEGCL